MAYFRINSHPDIGAPKRTEIDALLAEIRAKKEGRSDRWRIGRDFTRGPRKSRPNRWELTDPYFWALIAAKDSLFLDPPRSISGRLKCAENRGILSRVCGPERGPPGLTDGWPKSPHGRL